MSFIAYPKRNWKLFDYILGNSKMSIAIDRYKYLSGININNPIKIALMDRETKYWTKWVSFPGPLYPRNQLEMAIDVHRSILKNEIVIESDYPTYEENYEAAKIIGNIIENKGFKPLYYYSGNKSIHIHVFFDWGYLNIDNTIYDNEKIVFDKLEYTIQDFKIKFIEWLRTKMITCWDTNIRKFDSDLIKATHLIRCELSKNKKGYKTFLGYSYKDLSFIPYICNENNRIYPRLGKIRLSVPNNINELIDEFLENEENKNRKHIRKKSNYIFNTNNYPLKIRDCVRAILSEDFKKVGDGFQRGMFILVSELRRVLGDDEARIVVNDWNIRMGSPVKDSEIDYRFKNKKYSLTNKYIYDFLEEIGIKKY